MPACKLADPNIPQHREPDEAQFVVLTRAATRTRPSAQVKALQTTQPMLSEGLLYRNPLG